MEPLFQRNSIASGNVFWATTISILRYRIPFILFKVLTFSGETSYIALGVTFLLIIDTLIIRYKILSFNK